MEINHIQSLEVSVPVGSEEDKQKWIEEHADRLQHLFRQWQKPLSIDGEQYRKYLTEELVDCYDKPLLRSLIESIT